MSYATTPIGAFADHRGRSADAQRRFDAATTIAQAAHQDGDIGTPLAAIGVKFVQHNELQAMRVADHFRIKPVLPGQQQFKHHKIGQQNIRRIGSYGLTFFFIFLSSIAFYDRA